jgi:hypothetical protein
LLLSRLKCKKKCSNKNDSREDIYTFESQKLNYFEKKVGPAFWHYNVIRIWAMSGPFWRFLEIFCPLSPSFNIYVNMNIWLHNILCDFFYPFKTQGRIILGHTVLLLNSSHVRSFLKIPRNFLSLITSYPLLKMLFSTLSFLWTTAVGPRQNM